MDYLREKMSYKFHDKLELLLDRILELPVEVQVKRFNKLHAYIRVKFITLYQLQEQHPQNTTLSHNIDVITLCATSVTYAKQCVLSNCAEYIEGLKK